MLCGLSDKGRCKQVYSKEDISDKCETSDNKNQKRCKRKSVKKNPKINPKGNPKVSKKICPKGKILNPKTNRCIIDRKKQKTKKKKCPPGKILNPKTNRCIIDRKLPEGKVIDFKYRCKPDYIYNPQTQRCVKKDGPTGKKLMITSVTDKIGGPVSMHYYKVKVNNVMKHFLLFGDVHTQYVEHTSPEIIEITTLVKKIIRKSPHCIDIFSENPPHHDLPKGKKIQKYSSPLNAMRNEFYGCPVHHMSGVKCHYDNLRYQNWDLRFKVVPGSYKWLSNPYDELLMKYFGEYGDIVMNFGKTNIILYILGFTEKIKGNVYQTPKRIEQQMDEYFDERIEKRLKRETFVDLVSDKEFFQSTRKLIRKEYNKCIRSVKFPKDLIETFIKTYLTIHDEINNKDFTLVFTDFYTICRMFMKYDNNKSTPKKCKEKGKQNTSKHIIYYAGDLHTRNICKFLENMFGVKPIYTTNWTHPKGIKNKLIHLNNITNHLGYPLEDIESVDDLFKDFYE